jgi:hypothetical protein
VKYVIIAMSIASFLLGSYIGSKFSTRTDVRTVTTPATVKTVIQTKIVEVFPDGHTVEKVVVQTSDKVEASPQPAKPQYRAGILIQPNRKPDVRDIKISLGRRLFDSLWLDAQYDIRHKEILGGFSYEF